MPVIINRQNQGNGRQQPGSDYISGMIFKQTALPSGFSSSDRIKRVTSLNEAIALGINDLHSDETKATGADITITATGAANDVWKATILPSNGKTITLGSYTEQSGDTTTTIAAGLAAAINAATKTHGFSATSAAAVITPIAPDKYGASLNGAGLSASSDGTGTATVTQFSGGVGSEIAINYYHISEFFAIAEKITGLAQGILYVGIYASYDGTQVDSVRDFADGEIRQIGVFLPDTYASSQVTANQAAATRAEAANKPLSLMLAADFSATTISNLASQRDLNSKNNTTVISQDIEGEGGRLFGVFGKSVSTLGASLGAVANAAVHESIAWRAKFDMVHSRKASVSVQTDTINELEVLGFATGEKVKSQTDITLSTLTDDGYLFMQKETDFNGSFHNASPVSTSISSDFFSIERNRTIDKVARLTRINLIPSISAPLYPDAATGYLSEQTISEFTNLAFKALEVMAAAGEIATNADGQLPANSVVIDPTQNVNQTGRLEITTKIVSVDVAETIVANIGYSLSIS